jgi:hypothetical protein
MGGRWCSTLTHSRFASARAVWSATAAMPASIARWPVLPKPRTSLSAGVPVVWCISAIPYSPTPRRPDSMSVASANWSMPELPRSAMRLPRVSGSSSRPGAISQPRRSDLLTVPREATQPGRAPAANDRVAVVAELCVVVILDDQPVSAAGPGDQFLPAVSGEHDPGRPLVGGSDEHRPCSAALQRLDVQAVLVDGDRNRRHADGPCQFGRRVDRVGVLEGECGDAVDSQCPQQKCQCLRHSGVDHQLVAGGRDRVPLETSPEK